MQTITQIQEHTTSLRPIYQDRLEGKSSEIPSQITFLKSNEIPYSLFPTRRRNCARNTADLKKKKTGSHAGKSKPEKALCRKAKVLELTEKVDYTCLSSKILLPSPETSTNTVKIYSYDDSLEYLKLAAEIDTVEDPLGNTSIEDKQKCTIKHKLIDCPEDKTANKEKEDVTLLRKDSKALTRERLEKLSQKVIGLKEPNKQETIQSRKKLNGTQSTNILKGFKKLRVKLLENTSNETFTLTSVQIERIALEYAYTIFEEIACFNGLKIKESQEVDHAAKKVYERAKTYIFRSDRELVMCLLNRIENAIFPIAYGCQGHEIVSNLESGDRHFAKMFFYGTKPDELNLYPICHSIQKDLLNTYKVEFSQRLISTYIYEFLMEDKWKIFKTFSFRCSIFRWLEKVCRHAVYSRLRQEGFIPHYVALTPANTYLKMASLDPTSRDYLIDELIKNPIYRDALKNYFASKGRKKQKPLNDNNGLTTEGSDSIASESDSELKTYRNNCCGTNKDQKEFEATENHKILEKALMKLKQRLLDYPQEIEGVISPKNPSICLVPFDEDNHEINKIQEQNNVGEETLNCISSQLEKIITQHPLFQPELDYEHNLVNIILDNMPVSRRDRKILKLRLIEKKSRNEISDTIGICPKNVSLILYRLLPSVHKGIENWWRKNIDPSFSIPNLKR